MGVRTFTTAFQLTENPISQAGIWTNGGATGLLWNNGRTGAGKAWGTQPGNSGAGGFDDGITVLNGPWGSDQAAEAKVFAIATLPVPNAEVELLLHFSITANSATGYEFSTSVHAGGTQYYAIVRWNGALGDFTILTNPTGVGAVDGDVLAFTAVGSTLTGYKNGTAVVTTTDSTWTRGSPGMGFFLRNQTGNNDRYGFTQYACNDAGVLPSIGLPANLRTAAPTRGYTMTGWV